MKTTIPILLTAISVGFVACDSKEEKIRKHELENRADQLDAAAKAAKENAEREAKAEKEKAARDAEAIKKQGELDKEKLQNEAEKTRDQK